VQQFVNPVMTKEKIFEITDKAERALLKQICEKYDLKFFSGSTMDVIVTKQTP
jgi:hypothetical protein